MRNSLTTLLANLAAGKGGTTGLENPAAHSSDASIEVSDHKIYPPGADISGAKKGEFRLIQSGNTPLIEKFDGQAWVAVSESQSTDIIASLTSQLAADNADGDDEEEPEAEAGDDDDAEADPQAVSAPGGDIPSAIANERARCVAIQSAAFEANRPEMAATLMESGLSAVQAERVIQSAGSAAPQPTKDPLATVMAGQQAFVVPAASNEAPKPGDAFLAACRKTGVLKSKGAEK